MVFISEELREIIRAQIENMGYILWGVEIVPRRYSYLARIYIDRHGKEMPGVNDCALVNRALDLCLKEEKIGLEISTPGLARKFFDPIQYKDYIGSNVKIKTKRMINGQRRFVGKLISSDIDSLSISLALSSAKTTFDLKDSVMNFSHSDIEGGQLEPDYNKLFKK